MINAKIRAESYSSMKKTRYNPQGESIRIRLTDQLERKLITEKNRTGKSASQITREALEQYFRKR